MDLWNILKNKKHRIIFFSLNILILILYLVFTNLINALSIFSFSVFTLNDKIRIFFSSLFDISQLADTYMLVLVILFIISMSIFLLLSYILFRESKKINKKRGLWNTFMIFISILGLSCASCGIGLLASLLSFFSLSSLIIYFPLHGLELGFLGVLAINISNYFLLKRLKSPYTC